MPLGFERINERTQRPNAHINFIRPLPGPSASVSEQILNRVAAVCYPFMKANMILVQALEEFPYNTEFVGRNFNAGEVIQLVLKDRNGRWLPQKMVEMVMVHELAHCKQMNHSAAFWKVRDAYAVNLRALWARGYTGEGIWGRGRELESGVLQRESVDPGDVPEHLCGGIYGRRSRKRRKTAKAKDNISYAERKQRRILKKFGPGGQSLGTDQEVKVKLEGGAVKKGKPRVAKSARGRDLRAAAALARLETTQKEQVDVDQEETASDSETDDDGSDFSDGEAAVDVDGKKMVDDKGRALIKVCEDGAEDDADAQHERDEMGGFTKPKTQTTLPFTPVTKKPPPTLKKPPPTSKTVPRKGTASAPLEESDLAEDILKKRLRKGSETIVAPSATNCAICSLVNEAGSVTCMACSNVLAPHLDAAHWRCRSATCKDSNYLNAGDVGRCGVCGASKAAG